MNKIKFRDLSAWVKVAIITSWAIGGYWAATFLIAFFEELFYY